MLLGRPLKIMHVIAGADVGGAETYARDAICALSEFGNTQIVVTRPHELNVKLFSNKPDIALHFRDFSPLSRLTGGGGGLVSLANEFCPDVVHAWMSRAGSFIPKRMPFPVVGWLGGYYNIKNFKNTDAIISVTDEIRMHTILQGFPSSRSFTVNTFGTLECTPPVSRADFSTPADAPLLLVLSRMHPKKGIDLILRALTRLPGIYLWIAGDGPNLNEYKKLSEYLKISNRVRFLGWRTDRQSLLEQCDICVLPSRYEPFGTVIVEAWAAKRLLVTSNASGARQYVRDKSTGLVFEIDDIDGLVKSISTAIEDIDLRKHIIDNAHSEYLHKFTRDISIKNLIKIYRKVAVTGRNNKRRINVGEIDRSSIYFVKNEIINSCHSIKSSDAFNAAVVILSYLNYELEAGGIDRDYAIEAGILQLSGSMNFISGYWPDETVMIVDPEGIDYATRTFKVYEQLQILRSVSDRLRNCQIFG